ncbi:MAG: leucyl aminopeptidase family protein, partial [Algicola sp.]|nr:leucyl aminopeptidase family protein [Algicola sp.]
MSYPDAVNVSDIQNALTSGQWDSLIVVAPDFDLPQTASLNDFIKNAASVDARIGTQTVLMICDLVPGNRLILSPSGDVNGDYADARNFGDAANAAILMAKQSGSTRPLIWVQGAPDNEMYTFSAQVAYLGATQSLWQPLEARECREENLEPIDKIGIYAGKDIDENWLTALEAGRRVARDLCGTEPERMAPPKFAQYCVETFEDSAVTVTVRDDMDGLETDYPMMMAVARASLSVLRHQPRLVRLEYTGSGKIEKTLMLAGKGLVYDTGGADLKVGGHMAGMSRDKGGGAGVVGFLKTVAALKPKGLKVVAEIGVVRNSIGSDAFVPDEIITSHAGVRARIGNTDAEGRLVLGDLLSHLRVDALNEVNPQLFSVATLTGHAARSVGPYTALVENAPARRSGLSQKMVENGDLWGDPCEISRSRREDWSFIAPRTAADDVMSCNNAASAVTARGHQFPMAFLAISSGLDKHGCDSDNP